jgi:hypothetical protein
MLKKLHELLAQVRAAEKSAQAILASGEVGSKIDGTIQKLRSTAADIEERIRLLKEHLKSVSENPEPKAPEKPKAPAPPAGEAPPVQ